MNTTFRQHFPFFSQSAHWTYLDSAATTLKPQVLIDSTAAFYASAGSVHRSQYDYAQTQQYEHARDLVAQRFNVEKREAVVWTSGTTHAINLVAQGLEEDIHAGDEIIISVAEHHANFIPWQQLCLRKQAKLIVLPLNAAYQIDESTLQAALSEKTKLVAFNLVSNITGVRQPVEQLIPIIRANSKAKILLDIAQAVCSEKVDAQRLDADFYAFKWQSLNQLRPLFYGGKMLTSVSTEQLTLAELPYRLEAGTPNIAGIIGFGAVLAWLNEWDFEMLNQSLYMLVEQAYKRLKNYADLQIIGSQHSPTISFIFKHQHHADIAAILAEQQIAIRVGEHCAKPYLHYLKQSGTLRLSLAHYNNEADLNAFFDALDQALDILAS